MDNGIPVLCPISGIISPAYIVLYTSMWIFQYVYITVNENGTAQYLYRSMSIDKQHFLTYNEHREHYVLIDS